jgi:hypothetical protein
LIEYPLFSKGRENTSSSGVKELANKTLIWKKYYLLVISQEMQKSKALGREAT